MSKEPRISLPRYRLGDIFKTKQKIQKDPEILQLVSETVPLESSGFDTLSQRLRDLLPPGIELRTILDSLLHLAGSPLTKERLAEEAWRLAANTDRLKRWQAVPPWQRQPLEEWVPLQVIDLVQGRNWRGDAGATITFRILAGSPAGLTAERFWTVKHGRYVASKIGFSPPWERFHFERLAELMNLRLYGKLVPEKSLERPVFELVATTHGLAAHNRQILKARLREGFQCPKKYKHPCYLCHVGCDQCPCGVHPRSYVKKFCETCQKEAWMDPLHVPLKICVECLNKKNLTREK